MTRRQMDRFVMLRGVRDLLRVKAEQLLTAPAARRQMPVLEAAVDRLDVAMQQQMLANDQRRSTRGVARRRLVELMTEMAALAHILERGTQAAFVQFKLPRPQTDHRIRVTAELFLELAAPMEQQFADHGFHGVLVDLQTRIDDFDRAIQRGDAAARNSAAAQAVIAEALTQGAAALAVFDVIVRATCRHDAGMCAAWRTARGLKLDVRRWTLDSGHASQSTLDVGRLTFDAHASTVDACAPTQGLSEAAAQAEVAIPAATVDESASLKELVDTGISVDLNLETSEAETRQRPKHARKRRARRPNSTGERTVPAKARRAATGWRQETREARGKTTVGAGRSTATGLHQVTESEGRIRGRAPERQRLAEAPLLALDVPHRPDPLRSTASGGRQREATSVPVIHPST